jgi:hypothetical protein
MRQVIHHAAIQEIRLGLWFFVRGADDASSASISSQYETRLAQNRWNGVVERHLR